MCLSEGLTNTYIIVETRKKKRNNDKTNYKKAVQENLHSFFNLLLALAQFPKAFQRKVVL